MKKLRVGILFGGRSAEHEVSLWSAKNVVQALDRQKYEPVLIGIDKRGRWLLGADQRMVKVDGAEVALVPGEPAGRLVEIASGKIIRLDVVFPVLHGPMGEDGSVQGSLELANVPYVGAGVLGSSVGMDKDVMKRLLHEAGVPVAQFMVVMVGERDKLVTSEVVKQLGLPLFVKPANMGSSVGVTRVERAEDLSAAVNEALRFDRKVLIEEQLRGDEIECSVLGNDTPRASLPGRVMVDKGFYSYEAKYINEDGVILEIPVKLEPELVARIQEMSVRAFRVLGSEGMARVDMFVDRQRGVVSVNEINTLPGFTDISMYPKLWEASGLTYRELITDLITLALERRAAQAKLSSSYGKPAGEQLS